MTTLLRVLTLVALTASTLSVALGGLGAGAIALDDCPTKVEPAATSLRQLDTVVASYAALPGFVDMIADPSDPHGLIALFDAAFASTPLPAGVEVGGVTIRVVADTFQPLIAPADANAPPLIPVICSNRISPGVGISTPVGGCSLNFIFTDGSKTYAGTAGHCFSGLGQRASVSGLGQVGSVVFFINGGIGRDFALIQIDSNKVPNVNAAMCHWGGPTGPDGPFEEGPVRHYGFGIGWSSTVYTRPRTGYTFAPGSGDSFTFTGTASSGDSGSGARMDGGLALGVITHVNGPGHSAPLVFGTKISRGMEMAEDELGIDLTLVTAPVA